MKKTRSILVKTLISSVFAVSALSFQASGSVLLQNWSNSGDAGFGSLVMGRNDDGSSSRINFNDFEDLAFDSGLNFFGTVQNSFFVNNNGNITFNERLSTFTPDPFPISSQPMIAPFWGDVDTRCDDCGEVYLGSPNAETLVVTWNQVGFFSSDSSLTNTFQLVLIDRADTGAGNFDVEFRYEDINWTTGGASGGSGGLGGTPAQAGYDAGDGVNFFVVPGSRTADVVNLDTNASNTGTNGIWKFAVRDGELPGDTAENPILPVVDPTSPTDYEFEFVITTPDRPIFIDPDVAIGYDYIVNSGPNIVSVILPTGFDDELFDLWLWDDGLATWFDTSIDIIGGVRYDFANPVDRFRILGIDTSEMVDPTDVTAFVTGLTFDSAGLINMNQNAITQFVGDVNPVPAPMSLSLFVLAAGLVFSTRKRYYKV